MPLPMCARVGSGMRTCERFVVFVAELLLIGLMVSLAVPAQAETIPATPSVQTRASSSFVYAYSAISCGGSQVLAPSQFIYDSVASAGAAIPQSAINSHVQNSWGPQYCGDTRATGVRGAANESNLTMIVQRYWQGVLSTDGHINLVFQRTTGCPSPWVVSGQNCTITTYSCPSTGGWSLDGSNCTRPDNGCTSQSGQAVVKNYTVGWQRTSDPNDWDFVVAPSPGLYGSTVCVAGCQGVVGNSALAAYVSGVPASNGLHRVSIDVLTTMDGTTCGTPTAAADPTTAPPPCPGQIGQVNGKPVCFGTTGAPLPSNPAPGNMPPGTQGNPAAGPVPTSGPGSGTGGPGRTPLVGSGGNSGGGSSAALPGGGSEGNGQIGSSGGSAGGTADRPADPCGLPGRPPCKIDETGTPDGSSLNAAANALKAAGDSVQSAVADVSKPTSLGWTFGLSIPEGTCEDFSFWRPGGTWGVGLCTNPLALGWRMLLAWLMAGLTMLHVYRSVTGTLANKG